MWPVAHFGVNVPMNFVNRQYKCLSMPLEMQCDPEQKAHCHRTLQNIFSRVFIITFQKGLVDSSLFMYSFILCLSQCAAVIDTIKRNSKVWILIYLRRFWQFQSPSNCAEQPKPGALFFGLQHPKCPSAPANPGSLQPIFTARLTGHTIVCLRQQVLFQLSEATLQGKNGGCQPGRPGPFFCNKTRNRGFSVDFGLFQHLMPSIRSLSVPARQWPEVSDFVACFCMLCKLKNHCHARIACNQRTAVGF